MIYLSNIFIEKSGKRKGASLVLVIGVFVIITILLSSASFIFSSNLRQASHQQNGMKAHYLALSGIEAAKSTLLSNVDVIDGKDVNMIEYIKLNPNSYSKLEDSIVIDGTTVEIVVDYDKDNKIIYITSKAQYNQVSRTLKLKMDVQTEKYRESWE